LSDRRRGIFPEGFTWGAATSAYQIEGAVDVDGRGPSIWDTFSAIPGKVVGGDSGAVAADHYHRYRDDVTLMARLGMRAYRFSVAWPRIMPSGRGQVEERGLDFYRRLVDELLAHGIEPYLTLYHWDLPQALQDAGGWPARDTGLRFAEYAEVVYRALHDRVMWWSTINEPWCVALLGHAAGKHAPGERDPRRAIPAIHHVLLAHGLAVRAMRAIDPTPRQGIVLNLAPIRAAEPSPEAAVVADVRHVDGYRNRVWLEPLLQGRYPSDMVDLADRFGGFGVQPGDLATISTPIDWLGINYYNDIVLAAGAGPVAGRDGVHPGVDHVHEAPPVGDSTDMGWPVTPDGLRELLVSIGRDYPNAPPMVITENGAAYDDPILADGTIDDVRRVEYIRRHLLAVSDAITEGADVRGYLVWSLLDNFEWAEGYSKRFGIVHVDYQTLLRTPRRSAHWYREVMERNGVAPGEAT
jgi:beta-glucosidase